MNIGVGLKVAPNMVGTEKVNTLQKKEEKLVVGKKVDTNAKKAADISISDNSKKQYENRMTQDIAMENIMSMTCDIEDVMMADDMIRSATGRMLERAEESMNALSEQSVLKVAELLK